MKGQSIRDVRVSTLAQNTERQLEQGSVDRLYTNKAAGKGTQRTELERLIACVREVDTVVVFGDFPARRAAQMDPIDALRHE